MTKFLSLLTTLLLLPLAFTNAASVPRAANIAAREATSYPEIILDDGLPSFPELDLSSEAFDTKTPEFGAWLKVELRADLYLTHISLV